MNKNFSQTIFRGSIGMAIAIIFGAFGAHLLKHKLPIENLEIYEVAVKYQIYGCLSLIIMGILMFQSHIKISMPIAMMQIGILIFCGSLYFLSVKAILGIFGLNWIGAITPIGGTLMILAWFWVGINIIKQKN